MKTSAGNLHLNTNTFLIISNYSNGHLLFKQKCGIYLSVNLHINFLSDDRISHVIHYCIYKNQALVKQLTVGTKTCVILYSNPSVLDDEGGVGGPPSHPFAHLRFTCL